MPEPLACYKSRKLQYEYGEALRHFGEVSPDPSRFDPRKAGFWLWVYQVDNCLGDLFSMWEGLSEEVHEWASSKTGRTRDRPRKRDNRDTAAILADVGHGDLAGRWERFFREDVEPIRGARNGITHQSFPLTVAVDLGREIDLQLRDPVSGKTFNFFRDALAHHRRLRAFVLEVRRELGLPVLEDRM